MCSQVKPISLRKTDSPPALQFHHHFDTWLLNKRKSIQQKQGSRPCQKVVYKGFDKYHFFLIGLNRRNTSLSVGSQRLRPDTKVQYFGDSKPIRKK